MFEAMILFKIARYSGISRYNEGPRNCTGLQMIPGPQMIPDRKWSPNWTANDPGPEMISDRDRKWSRLKNKEWHGWWDGVDRELAYVNTDVFIKAILQL